jgi:hypothetical protein
VDEGLDEELVILPTDIALVENPKFRLEMREAAQGEEQGAGSEIIGCHFAAFAFWHSTLRFE